MELLGLDCAAPLTFPSDPESHSMPPEYWGGYSFSSQGAPSAGSPPPAREMKTPSNPYPSDPFSLSVTERARDSLAQC